MHARQHEAETGLKTGGDFGKVMYIFQCFLPVTHSAVHIQLVICNVCAGTRAFQALYSVEIDMHWRCAHLLDHNGNGSESFRSLQLHIDAAGEAGVS